MRTTHRWLRDPLKAPMPMCEACGLFKLRVPFGQIYMRIDWDARTTEFPQRAGKCPGKKEDQT
jgi:hypothetical protein